MTDIVLLLLVLLFAASGYRQGFVVGTLSFAGFFSGTLVGLQLGPPAARLFGSPGVRVAVSLSIILLIAIAGQTLAGWFGARIRHRLVAGVWRRRADETGGAVVSVIAVLLVAWLVALPLASSSVPWLARSIRASYLLGAVDRLMPPGAEALTAGLTRTLDTRGLPDVYGGLGTGHAPQVPPPDPALTASPAATGATPSVVKIDAVAEACDRNLEGSGFVYADGRVMTNAHVVAGTGTVAVTINGNRLDGRVTVYDPARDLAVILVPGLRAEPLLWSDTKGGTGDDALVLGYPLGGPHDVQPARLRSVGQINGPDIYRSDEVKREIYTIRALVRHGNSGGPLLGMDGRVLGVVFAAAEEEPDTAFAIGAAEAAPVAAAGLETTRAADTGECT